MYQVIKSLNYEHETGTISSKLKIKERGVNIDFDSLLPKNPNVHPLKSQRLIQGTTLKVQLEYLRQLQNHDSTDFQKDSM